MATYGSVIVPPLLYCRATHTLANCVGMRCNGICGRTHLDNARNEDTLHMYNVKRILW